MNLKELILKGESITLDLKEKLPTSINFAKTVIAFSNTAGGKIIIGVNDKKEVIGVNENEIFTLRDKIVSIIHDMCYPTILPEIYTNNIDGNILLVIEIFRGGFLPYYLKKKGKQKGTYIRIGATNRPADKTIIMELERQRMGKSFDEEENFEVNIENIDIKPVLNEFEKSGKGINNKQLKNLKLIKNINGKDVSTNALFILTGYLDNTSIKCARFKGITKDVFLDKKEFDKDIFYNLENAVLFLKNHLNLKAEIKGLKRTEEYEIPIVVLREILLNAIIHRDYTKNSDIKVAVYDDIVEIVSPGGLPNGLTIEEIYNGRSELRNKVIARVFKELGYVETWGSGIIRIVKICKKKDIKFELKDEGNFVSAVFYRDLSILKKGKKEQKQSKINDYERFKHKKTRKKPARNPQETRIFNELYLKSLGLNERQIKAITYVEKHGRITNKEYRKLFKVSERTALNDLKELYKKGLFKKIGETGRSTHYILKENFEL